MTIRSVMSSSSGPAPAVINRLVVLIIRPSRYDDDGYVVRHWRGTLPSNTLSCLNGLVRDAVAGGALGPIDVDVRVFDEAVDRVDPARLGRRFRRPGTTVLAMLAGVQSNQFARAADLARACRAEGFAVMIGGFHVSGSMALARDLPPECRALVDDGVTVVAGEVEGRVAGLLRDAAAGQLQPVYNFLETPPDLSHMPLPRCSPRLQRRFAVRAYGTIDAGRGCPFNCSFCTIINVQGRRMRCRDANQIIDHVRAHYRIAGAPGIRNYFFTDDNFARNPEWEAILDGLIALRRDEGLAIDFMMQVDIAAARIPRLVEKAAQAGCVQVFIGLESLREDNLAAVGKRQNRVATYRDAIARWHAAGIICHTGFIIGFPFDTYDRIMEDVRTLRDELEVDQASFFMLTPLPGSRDHQQAEADGTVVDRDLNNYDSFHPVTAHPRMSREEWTAAYLDAWKTFYSYDHMRRVLLRQNPHTYWGMFKCFVWYRAAMAEGSHPMMTGFVRLKDRRSRRPGFPVEGRLAFLARRAWELLGLARSHAKLVLEMQELWVETRIRGSDYAFVRGLRAGRTRAAALLDLKAVWHDLHARLASGREQALDRLRRSVPSPPMQARLDVFRQMRRDPAETGGTGPRCAVELSATGRRDRLGRLRSWFNVFGAPSLESRRALSDYWRRTARHVRDWRVWKLNPVGVAWNGARDLKNTIVFFIAMAGERF